MLISIDSTVLYYIIILKTITKMSHLKHPYVRVILFSTKGWSSPEILWRHHVYGESWAGREHM